MTTAQDQQSRELLPCPFCGCPGHRIGGQTSRAGSFPPKVRCVNILCAAETPESGWNHRTPASKERTYTCPTRTVADLVSNLLLLDQTLPIYGAQYIEHPPGKRRAITVPPTVSREKVKDGRWIGEGDDLNAAVIWTRAEQPGAQERKPLTDEQIQDLIGFGDPTEQECHLVRLGWSAAQGITPTHEPPQT